MEYQVYNWYHFCWLCGDNICEQHIHNLDVGNWVIGTSHPVEANGMGGCTARYLGDTKGTGQIFDHHFVEFTYADGTKMFSQCRHMKAPGRSVSEAAHGTKGTSNCAGEIDGENEWRFDGKGVSGHQQEQTDLIAALRAGKRYNEGYYGATSSMTAVLGRMANYSGKVVKWDDAMASDITEFPENLAWDAPAPVQKDDDGDYPIPIPGLFPPSDPLGVVKTQDALIAIYTRAAWWRNQAALFLLRQRPPDKSENQRTAQKLQTTLESHFVTCVHVS